MKQVTFALVSALLLIYTSAFSYTSWLTTKNALSSGNCRLESNKIRIIVNTYSIDVEEEAEISTTGTVYAGDPNTLEIKGEFLLSPGSAMRSLLLWNGNKLLKAKLLDRDKADSTINQIINYTYRDPALIKYMGKNRYSFRIYPVSINNSRKVRVLYTVPLQSGSGALRLEIRSAFTLGAEQVPTQIPVEIIRNGTSDERYILQHKNTKKSIQFGSTYLIPFSDFYQGGYYYCYSAQPEPLVITLDTSGFNKAFTYGLETTKAAGYYTAIFSYVPDPLKKQIAEALLFNYTIETKIQTAENNYITDIPKDALFGIYLKTKTPWDGKLKWNVYDNNGTLKIQYVQNMIPDTTQATNAVLPLLWGAKYSLSEGLGSLGGIFGFVDNKMSLLALERDSLKAEEAALWLDKGVPPLLANEIIADTAKISVPKENIIIDISEISTTPGDALKLMHTTIDAHNRVIIQFKTLNGAAVSIRVFDLKGRLVYHVNNLKVAGKNVSFNLPAVLKGMFLMRVSTGTMQSTEKIIIK